MDSSDPELVRDRLFGFYGASHFDIASQKNAFAVRANHLQIGGLGLSYCDYANDVSVGFGEDTFRPANIQSPGRGPIYGRRKVGGDCARQVDARIAGVCAPKARLQVPLLSVRAPYRTERAAAQPRHSDWTADQPRPGFRPDGGSKSGYGSAEAQGFRLCERLQCAWCVLLRPGRCRSRADGDHEVSDVPPARLHRFAAAGATSGRFFRGQKG